MHRLSPVIVALALLVAALAPSSPAWAQKRVPTVGVVDLVQIMQNSEAAKAIRTQMEKISKSYQSAIAGEKDKLEKEAQDIEQQRATIAADAMQQKQREFQTKVTSYERELQGRRNKLADVSNGALKQVQDAIVAVVAQIAKESQLTLVITKDTVLFDTAELDITADVMKRLNAKLPTVAVQVPKE
jgi:outer membrane protein